MGSLPNSLLLYHNYFIIAEAKFGWSEALAEAKPDIPCYRM
jgi:hypothetical protein